jgi:hypothetical protein
MMSAILAFPVHLHRPESGTSGEHVAGMDLFVLINLAFLLFMLGFFACWAWLIWRRTTNPPPHIQLLMELDEEASHQDATTTETSQPAGEPEPAPWEREQDWWKK